MIFQTEKYVLKLGKKGNTHYVALQDKKTLDTLVHPCKNKKDAEVTFHKMIEKPSTKTVNADGKE